MRSQFSCKSEIANIIEDKTELQSGKYVEWNILKSGDCTMDAGARLTVYQDGSYNFHSVVSSTDSNDEWCYRIDLLDSSGAVLVSLPLFHEKTCLQIPNENTRYVRDKDEGPREQIARAYGSWTGARMYYDC